MAKKAPEIQDYQYGFHDKDVSVFRTKKGLTREIVEEISKIKDEPAWMLEFRLKALDIFNSMPMPKWGGDLDDLDFNSITYYVKPSEKQGRSWDEVPEEIKATFDKLGIPEAEQNSSRVYPLNTNPRSFTTTCRKTWKNWAFCSATWIRQ